VGTGRLEVADWWLETGRDEETEAAAKPATTMVIAKIRIASFMVGIPLMFLVGRKINFPAR